MDYKIAIAKLLSEHIEALSYEEILNLVEHPKNKDMGDFAFPCFKLAQAYRKAPVKIAEDLKLALASNEIFENVTAVSGFLNFTLNQEHFIKTILTEVLTQGADYGKSTIGEQKKVIVEYSSVNIAKPFHMGHIRSTMIGESLNRIYKFLGYDTVAINHLGDYGTQFGKLIVAYKLWGNKEVIEADPINELLKIYVRFHNEAEEKPELDDEARAWFTKLENSDEEAVELWTMFKEMSLKVFDRVYGLLGVTFDSYAGESFYSDKMPGILTELRTKHIVQKSEGAEIVDLEPYGMPPALITKKDGSSLYMTRDLAAAKFRKDYYNFDKNIYVVGSAQKLHFQQWIKIIELMGYAWHKDCIHVEFGMVSLEEGSLSTRKGQVVFLEDVLQKAIEQTQSIINEKNPNLVGKEEVARQVGVGAVVFQELYTSRTKDYSFSLEKTLSFDGETGPYVQYTHARACSVLRKAGSTEAIEISKIDFSKLDDEASKEVVRLLSKYNESIVIAHRNYEPHTIARFVVELAQNFNRFYHDNPILVDDENVKTARLAIVKAVKIVIESALHLVCLEAPEQM
ncbi:arginine--tRNA ligase [Fusibacter sp. 3D3]|uniref:arginine--tRNA ligase n=1 Tax=Fusibacter sp. 3D3 TaxID=1048380 RepID=UPI0008532916|nr:arginine--tRNA ligase [Fusibacter sp. 3D3]GAU79756.1 arginyl-tRNA synthetase [Fusibacter sp. 3D3]